MRLLYLGLILCMEISSPNGATVGKKRVCCPVLWYFLPPPCRASVHRPAFEPMLQMGSSAANHTAGSSIIGSSIGITKQRAGFCCVKSVR